MKPIFSFALVSTRRGPVQERQAAASAQLVPQALGRTIQIVGRLTTGADVISCSTPHPCGPPLGISRAVVLGHQFGTLSVVKYPPNLSRKQAGMDRLERSFCRVDGSPIVAATRK